MNADRIALARVTEELERLVRAVEPEDRDVDQCIALADAVVANWDNLIKPILRRAL